MLFAIDHGNSAIKTLSFVFTSGLTDYPVKPPVETDVLEFGGTFWTLSGERIPYMRDKTKDERFFILSLFAIAKELRQREALQPMVEAELAIGLPPEHYELRNRFAEYFKRGTVQFKFNDTAISLMIRQVLVYPQAYAAVVPQAQIIQQNPVPLWWISAASPLICFYCVVSSQICSSAAVWRWEPSPWPTASSAGSALFMTLKLMTTTSPM